MDRVQLSAGGPEISRLAWGAWRLAAADDTSTSAVRARIDRCLENGITTIDHADIYGGYRCEELFGNAIREAPGLADQIEIVTKCAICLSIGHSPVSGKAYRVKHYDTSEAHIVASAERSLEKLSVERLDVLLLHRPDPLTDPDETASALSKLRASGKIRAAGVSNFTPAQFDLLQSRLDFQLVTNQIEVHPLHLAPFTDGTLDHCQKIRIRPMAWSPMAGGRLFTGGRDLVLRVRGAIVKLADELGASLDQAVLAWLLTHPSGLIPVIGTGKLERIDSAAAAASMRVERQSWFEVYEAALGGEVP